MANDIQAEAAVVRQLAEDRLVVEHYGRKFSPLPMIPVIYEPRPAPLKVRSLSAITGYIAANPDVLDLDNLLVHVQSPDVVAIISTIGGADRKRDNLLNAEYDGTKFRFGEWMSPEAFIIGLNALFIPSTGRDSVLNYVSRLKIEDEAAIIDDGISQTAQVRVGIKGNLTDAEKAPSRVVLVPFRTFREVEQPESEFIFRMRRDEKGVFLSLHEADGGAWRQIAMERIAEWIVDNMPGGEVTVIA